MEKIKEVVKTKPVDKLVEQTVTVEKPIFQNKPVRVSSPEPEPEPKSEPANPRNPESQFYIRSPSLVVHSYLTTLSVWRVHELVEQDSNMQPKL